MDMLVPRGWTDPATARAVMTAESHGPTALGPGAQRLPFEGEVEYLGSRVESLFTRHAPRYADIVARQLAALGWERTTFDLYRCVVPYPVLNASVHVVVGGEA